MKPVNEEALKLGISPLHCHLNTFKYVYNIGCKLPNEKYRNLTAEEKLMVERKTAEIKEGFQERLGLVVEQVKQGRIFQYNWCRSGSYKKTWSSAESCCLWVCLEH